MKILGETEGCWVLVQMGNGALESKDMKKQHLGESCREEDSSFTQFYCLPYSKGVLSS